MNTQTPEPPRKDPITLDSVARTVSEVEGHPKDYLEVAVILEILGYSLKDVQAMGYKNVFELAKDVYDSVSRFSVQEDIEVKEEPKPNTIGLFFLGMFYNLGWVIMLISLFLGGQSLWAARDLPTDVSTAIGFGVIFGLVSTGGIQQFTAWKLIYYQLQGNKPLAKFMMRRNVVVGFGILLVTCLIFVLLNAFALSLPGSIVIITLYFLILIGTFRIFAAPIFAFKRFWALIVVSVSALVAMFASYFVLAFLGVNRVTSVIGSQSIGLAVLISTSIYFTYIYIFSEREVRDEDEPPFYSRPFLPTKVKPPRYWVLVYEGFPLILYGTLYFVFIFGDRLVSWIGAGPLLLSYNRTYQIGVDLALLMLIPITGVKFTYLYTLSGYLEKNLRALNISNTRAFSKVLRKFYKRMMTGVSLFAFLFLLIAFVLGDMIVFAAGGNAESALVFKWALMGIFFFSFFLTNSVFSFCFKKNKPIVAVLTLGCILAYTLCYMFSTVDHWLAVFGFVLSSMFLALASLFVVLDMIERADYVYYQSF